MEIPNIPTRHEPFVAPERALLFWRCHVRPVLKLAQRGDLPGHPAGFGVRQMCLSPLGAFPVAGAMGNKANLFTRTCS
jgi:hypothetical protein